MFARSLTGSFCRPSLAFLLTLAIAAAPSAWAAPVPGFIEEFPGTSLGTWQNLSGLSNPGAGGFLGPSDGYLLMTNTTPFHLGAYSDGPEYTGNFQTAGVQSIELYLNDVGTDDPIEIHVSIGRKTNHWQYNEGFNPPHNLWGRFVVDLTDASKFTRTKGSGTFAQALQNANLLHIRHDLAPFISAPDDVAGDVGLDHIVLSDVNVPVRSTSWGRIKAAYR